MKKIFVLIILCSMAIGGYTQTDAKKRFEELRARQKQSFVKKRSQQQQRFDQIRREQNKRYIEFMRKNWEKMGISPALEQKQEEKFVPMTYELDTMETVNETSIVAILDTIPIVPNDTLKEETIVSVPDVQVDVDNEPATTLEQYVDAAIELDMALALLEAASNTNVSLVDTIVEEDEQVDSPEKESIANPDVETIIETKIESIEVDTVLLVSDDTIPTISSNDSMPLLSSNDTMPISNMDTISVDTLSQVASVTPVLVEDEVLFIPEPEPQPQPMVPIMPIEQPTKKMEFTLYGTHLSVNVPIDYDIQLRAINEADIANVWEQLTDSAFDIAITSCIEKREQLKLCDWAYLRMVQTIGKSLYGESNEAIVFAAYIMSQTGYKVRMARSEKAVYMLLASHYEIYGLPFFMIDGERFYLVDGAGETSLYICEAMYDKEQKLSLRISDEQYLAFNPSSERTLVSKKGISTTVRVNRNSIEFYDDYPTGYMIDDIGTKWSTHVTTPLEQSVKHELYPQLSPLLKEQTSWQAVNTLLNWVQTAFEYKFDNEVWGEDRVFFASETLHYPYSDCEDRSILFSTLVRDLLGLDVVLLYFPNHLATAVHIPNDTHDCDYVEYNNKRFVVCDPTFMNAPAGKQMPCFNGVKAQVIVIN